MALRFFALWCATVALALGGCVSRSLPGERFSESKELPAPTNGVVLGDPENFTFALVGDLHVAGADTSRLSTILAASQADGDAFQLLLGDLVDKGREGDFQAILSVLNAGGWTGRVFAAIGNHDIFYDGWTNYRNAFGPSHYSVTIGNSKFIVLDTADGTVGRAQLAWFRETLAATRPTHLFVVSHYLPVVPGVQTYLKIANQEEATLLMKLAKTHRVTAWLGGHYHSYIETEIDGVKYVVAGGGGGRRMGPVERYFYAQASVTPTSVSFEMHPID